MTRGIAYALIAGLLATAVVAHAQTATDAVPDGWSAEAAYDALVESTVTITARQIAEIEAGRRSARASIPLRSPVLTTANAATAVELAQAAISTSVAGADAGVTVSPLALFGGKDSPLQVPITLAALKDGVARLQLGLTWLHLGPRRNLLDRCTIDEAAIRAPREDLQRAYVTVCNAVAGIPLLATSADRDKPLALEVRQACGLEREATMTLGRAAAWIAHGLVELRPHYAARVKALNDSERANPSPDAAAVVAVANALERVSASGLAALDAYRPPPRDSCKANEAAALERAEIQAAWATARTRIGLSLRGDLFEHRFGFNPDAMVPLPDGRLKDGELRLELAYTQGGFEVAGGIGYGRARGALDGDLGGYLSPSLSLAWTAASLSGESLYDALGRLRVVNGALPPRLVIGLDVQAQYAPSPPATQAVNLQKLSITPFVDFRFTDTLAVRLGVPVNAELASRSADEMKGIAAKQDRQWSVPAFVATVIKF